MGQKSHAEPQRAPLCFRINSPPNPLSFFNVPLLIKEIIVPKERGL